MANGQPRAGFEARKEPRKVEAFQIGRGGAGDARQVGSDRPGGACSGHAAQRIEDGAVKKRQAVGGERAGRPCPAAARW